MAKTTDTPGRDWFKGDWDRGYPWADWLDGNVWELEQGVDFHETIEAFRNRCYRVAEGFDEKVRTRSKGTTIWIQSYLPPPKRPRRPSGPAAP